MISLGTHTWSWKPKVNFSASVGVGWRGRRSCAILSHLCAREVFIACTETHIRQDAWFHFNDSSVSKMEASAVVSKVRFAAGVYENIETDKLQNASKRDPRLNLNRGFHRCHWHLLLKISFLYSF